MTSVISHLHAVVKEVEPTDEEWRQAIDFLTQVGHWCDDFRQEFILLSDTLGVTMLVDAVTNRKPVGTTESTVLGPFHVHGAPHLPFGSNISKGQTGEPTLVMGRVLSQNELPIAGATVDVWQASAQGLYDVQESERFPDMNLRAVFHTDKNGRFGFCTEKPASYPCTYRRPGRNNAQSAWPPRLAPCTSSFYDFSRAAHVTYDTSVCKR